MCAILVATIAALVLTIHVEGETVDNLPVDITREAFSFVEEVSSIDDARELNRRFSELTRALGFEKFICMQLAGPGGGLKPEELFGQWDGRWVNRYMRLGYHEHDAILTEQLRRDQPFSWTDIAKSRDISEKEQLVFNEIRDYGAHEGFAVPMRNMDGSLSSVALFGKQVDLSKEARARLHVICLFFAGAARRITREASLDKPKLLSPREEEIIKRLATGATQIQIADDLALSARTVETHLKRARAKFNVRTSHQLVAEAVWRGGIQL